MTNKQIKLFSEYYDVVVTRPSLAFGWSEVVAENANRVRLIIGYESDAICTYSPYESADPAQGIPFGDEYGLGPAAGGELHFKWTDDYTLTTANFWIQVIGTSAEFIVTEVIYHPERFTG